MELSVPHEGKKTTTKDFMAGVCWCSCVNHRSPEFGELKLGVARPHLKCGIMFRRLIFRLEIGKPLSTHHKKPEQREPWKLLQMKEADGHVQVKEGAEWLYLIQTESESSIWAGPEKISLTARLVGQRGWEGGCFGEQVSVWTLSLSRSDLLEC